MSATSTYSTRATAAIAVLCCAVLFCNSCDHHAEGHDHSAQQTATAQQPAADLALTLNNGKKWPTDAHTQQTAARMAARIGSTPHINSHQEALDLAASLDEDLETLVAGCTMTGKAHDQLHVFLLALFPKVAGLKEQTTLEDLEQTREEIGALFAAYEKHFE